MPDSETDTAPGLDRETRDKLLANPGVILADRDLMRALVDAREADVGANVVDIRGRAMEVLEHRLDRLEAQHENVIATAYDNQSSTAVIHRAVIGLLETTGLSEFVDSLQSGIAPLLRIETLRLVIEETPAVSGLPEDVVLAPEGGIAKIVAAGRRTPRGDDIVLRPSEQVTQPIHARKTASEALLPFDLGEDLPRAMLVMGSADAARFMPAHGTDLLRFFGQVFRLVLLMRLRK